MITTMGRMMPTLASIAAGLGAAALGATSAAPRGGILGSAPVLRYRAHRHNTEKSSPARVQELLAEARAKRERRNRRRLSEVAAGGWRR